MKKEEEREVEKEGGEEDEEDKEVFFKDKLNFFSLLEDYFLWPLLLQLQDSNPIKLFCLFLFQLEEFLFLVTISCLLKVNIYDLGGYFGVFCGILWYFVEEKLVCCSSSNLVNLKEEEELKSILFAKRRFENLSQVVF